GVGRWTGEALSRAADRSPPQSCGSHGGRIYLVRGSGGLDEKRRCRDSPPSRCRLCGRVGEETLAIPAAYGCLYSDQAHKKTRGRLIGPPPVVSISPNALTTRSSDHRRSSWRRSPEGRS